VKRKNERNMEMSKKWEKREGCGDRLEGGHKVKSIATPLQAWTGPEVSRRLRLPDFKTIGT